MSWETELVTMLETAATDAGNRIYAVVAPPNQAAAGQAYLVFSLIYGNPNNHLDGVGLLQRRVQLDLHAPTYDGAVSLLDQVMAAFEGWTARTNVLLGLNPDGYDEDTKYFTKSLDYSITY